MLAKLSPWMVHWSCNRLATELDRLLFGPSIRPEHVILAICDHFEPLWTGIASAPGEAPFSVACHRVQAWRKRYPTFAASFRDSSGHPPQHTFFYPGDQYDARLVEPLAELVAMGHGEVEVHLHHNHDTRQSLAEKLEQTLGDFDRHGIVTRTQDQRRWAFIHGNWCLANSRPDGAFCGVDDELDLLYQLGCYADFTFPSAPDPTQPSIINRIYYPSGDVRARRAHEKGTSARVGDVPAKRVLCVQGPLSICKRNQRPGLPVRIDAAAITARDPATLERLKAWIAEGVCIRDMPQWVFVKLSTHGAPEREASSLLGTPQRRFHEGLSWLAKNAGFRFHYVTAREMYNIARAAMDGKSGDPSDFRDYEIPPPPRACHA